MRKDESSQNTNTVIIANNTEMNAAVLGVKTAIETKTTANAHIVTIVKDTTTIVFVIDVQTAETDYAVKNTTNAIVFIATIVQNTTTIVIVKDVPIVKTEQKAVTTTNAIAKNVRNAI
tara:strand:- start:226 stop:579 length:354 start_codon:yes stop_codon:yes gene_type:complete